MNCIFEINIINSMPTTTPEANTLGKETRFGFGNNWKKYLSRITEENINNAQKAIADVLKKTSLEGLSFLDAGCGSGIHSLAALRMGAKIFSFDYDKNSVGCAQYLKQKFAIPNEQWNIMQGSVLDSGFMSKIGTFDVVYSWGVIHHTGNMWKGLDLIDNCVKPGGGLLFISIYNDQGPDSKRWKFVKKTYNENALLRLFWIITLGAGYLCGKAILIDTLKGRNPFKRFREYKKNRGMSVWTDVLDWLGGYPFEVAKPEEIFNFYKSKKYDLVYLKTCGGGLGCNEFVFRKQ